ncbi:MAG: response regulator transcription factor [Oscillospiraceae bacterium]|nr:response regulator transcription factor [Oscillospiraceae bacterium]
MRIAICDDENQCRLQAVQAIQDCTRNPDVLTDVFENGRAFLQAFRKHPYDLVFLDIEMPEMDGITLARHLRELHRDVPIVFLTSHIEYALEGYEVNALRYLTKPIQSEKLHEVLTHVMARMQAQRTLWLKTEGGEVRVPVGDILWLEAQNQNILIRTADRDYTVRYNLGEYEAELAQDGFFRIHRGYLVALRHVKSLGKHEVTLSDNTVLPVSRTKEKSLKEALFQYIREESI